MILLVVPTYSLIFHVVGIYTLFNIGLIAAAICLFGYTFYPKVKAKIKRDAPIWKEKMLKSKMYVLLKTRWREAETNFYHTKEWVLAKKDMVLDKIE